MGDIKLFSQKGDDLVEIPGEAYTIEKTLQNNIERNLETMLGVRFLASEYPTGKTYSGRIDTLGIDENGSPVIIEYKRATNENVINQGLFYLDWLLDHKAEFSLLVEDRFGKSEVGTINWSTARLVCIANQFLKYDEYAVKQIDRNIELYQYKKFGDSMILLELVNATTGTAKEQDDLSEPSKSSGKESTFSDLFSKLGSEELDLYENLKAYMLALGDDVQNKRLKHYEAFKRITNFACVEVHPQAKKIVVFLKLEPSEFDLEDGFTRDVSNIGHFGNGDLEVTIHNRKDLERALPLISNAYEKN
jgi:predicted transport protein